MKLAGIIQQGELDSLVTRLSAQRLKELMNSLIGLDALELAWHGSLKLINSFREVLRNKYGYDDTNLKRVTEDIGEQESIVSESTGRLVTLEAELKELNKRAESLDSKLKEMEPMK